ncbi:hypothetical protein [Bacillus cereus]|uniref:hypothetical protein n=1 Tax=Bacillus cereus TaxID=1396 RepID=UPI001E564F6B|nr:hypothetical protein [Bacillus cereus]
MLQLIQRLFQVKNITNTNIYHFPTEDSLLNLREGAIAPANWWESSVGWRKPKCLLPYTYTDFSLKTEDMRLVAEKSLQS